MIEVSPTDTLSIQLGAAPATTAPNFYASYFDSDPTDGVTAKGDVPPTPTNGTTPVTVLASPAAGQMRSLSSFYMVNIDTSPVTASIVMGSGLVYRVTLSVGDILEYEKNGEGWKVTTSGGAKKFVITPYSNSGALATLPAPAPTSGTSETLILKAAVPANSVQVGSTFAVECQGISSSTGTVTFKVRAGANGTTSDNTAWTSITSAAQVANQRAGFRALLVVRSIGAGGSIECEGIGYAQAALLPAVVAAVVTAAVATSAIWYIDITCTCSSGTWTAQQAVVNAF